MDECAGKVRRDSEITSKFPASAAPRMGVPKPLTEMRKSRCDSRQESGKTQFCLARPCKRL